MDQELKTWLKFWICMALILLGIVMSISGCTAYSNKKAIEAVQAGASGYDIDIATNRTNTDTMRVAAIMAKAQGCSEKKQ